MKYEDKVEHLNKKFKEDFFKIKHLHFKMPIEAEIKKVILEKDGTDFGAVMKEIDDRIHNCDPNNPLYKLTMTLLAGFIIEKSLRTRIEHEHECLVLINQINTIALEEMIKEGLIDKEHVHAGQGSAESVLGEALDKIKRGKH